MARSRVILLVVLFVLGIGLAQSVFYVNENEVALVLQLGMVVGEKRDPGLNFKIPFIQRAVLLDKRILSFLIPKTLGFSSDTKLFEIDNYVCWRITNPKKFIETLRAQDIATERLRSIVYAELQSEVRKKTLQEVVGAKRANIMETVRALSNKAVAEYGVEIVDVRVKRSDLPNRQAIFDRMNAERQKMANQYKAEGESASRDIKSNAERERDTTLAEAEQKSTVIRGQADAYAMQTMNKVIATSPEFYDLLKSLEVYKKAFKENTKAILSTDDPLLQFLR